MEDECCFDMCFKVSSIELVGLYEARICWFCMVTHLWLFCLCNALLLHTQAIGVDSMATGWRSVDSWTSQSHLSLMSWMNGFAMVGDGGSSRQISGLEMEGANTERLAHSREMQL